MEERTIKLSLEEAKMLWRGGVADKQVALKAFTEEELTMPNLPESWLEYNQAFGFDSSAIEKFEEPINTFERLLLLRDCYRDGWEPDWGDMKTKYCVCFYAHGMRVEETIDKLSIFTFQSEARAKLFMKNFSLMLTQVYKLF